MRALLGRIGLYRVAAILIGGALVLEIVRTQLLPAGSGAGVVCTFGEVALLAIAAAAFVTARRAAGR